MRRGRHDDPPAEPASEDTPEMAAIRRHLRAELGDPDPPPAAPIDTALREIRRGVGKGEALRSVQEMLLPVLGLLLVATILTLLG